MMRPNYLMLNGALSLALLVACWQASPGQMKEISSSVAAELVGGVDCKHYGTDYCGSLEKSTCPATIGFTSRFSPVTPQPAKPSGSIWCGCVTSCANTKLVKGIYPCGSQ